MSWLNTFLSWFKGSKRKKVRLAGSSTEDLEIIPYLPADTEAEFPLGNALLSDARPAGIAYQPLIGHRVVSRGLTYFNSPGGSPTWVPPQYDHAEIEVLYDVEAYFARATRAKLALFLREGFEFIGPSDSRVEYIRGRFRQISRASGIPLEVLLLQTCRDLIVHCNCYWLKVRNVDASGGRLRKVGNRTLKPVAGYFRLPPETVIPEIDAFGNITRWKQDIEGIEKIFSTDDIVHFYINKKGGYPLGIPTVVPSIDDIRALRSIEHNIDVLIHKHLFPIVLWRVGNETRPAETYADGTTEISDVKSEIANMPTEGSLVVSERYDVKAIGVENKALKVDPYLTHYRDRLLAGFDVSSIDIGVGNTASRSTANTLSRNLMDIVKLLQIAIEGFSAPVIEELLLESTFSEGTALDPDNLVYLKFPEIDKAAKQAEANHYTDLFMKNVLSYPELRESVGREPLTKSEEKDLWWNKFGKEQALIASVDESSGQGAQEPSGGSITNKNQPANQHGSRNSAKLNKDSYQEASKPSNNPILSIHNGLSEELQERWVNGPLDLELAIIDIGTAYDIALTTFSRMLRETVRSNFYRVDEIQGLYKAAEVRAEKYIYKLRNDVIRSLRKGDQDPSAVFSSLRYRTILICDTELSIARNSARFRWFTGNQEDVVIVASDSPCELCKSKLTTIRWNDRLGEAKIPPFHPVCKCQVRLAGEGR